jgi:DNA-binding transcriptional MerR regulator
MMTVKEVAKLSGVTIRTLRYYDKIGLLTPAKYTENGYRLYDVENLMTLQQILLYKELGFSLKMIQEMLSKDTSNNQNRLLKQEQLLLLKRQQVEGMITQVRRLIEGGTTMDFEVFKQTFASKITSEVPEKTKEELLANITPEIAERVDEVWGIKEFFELNPAKAVDLKRYIEEGSQLLGQIVEENDKVKTLNLVKEWVQLSVTFAQVADPRVFAKSMLKDYQTNVDVIKYVEQKYGVEGRQKIIDALNMYLTTV